MAVEHAFGVARGAGGVAQAGGRVLIKHRPVEMIGFRRNQGFIALQVGQQVRLGHVRFVRHDDHGFQLGQLIGQGLQNRHEVQVGKQHAIVCVFNDVANLILKQTRVDGVAHQARARYAVIQLQVTIAVPGQGSDAVAMLQTHFFQRIGQLLAALGQIGIGVPVNVAFNGLRDDLSVCVIVRCVTQYG